MQLPNVEAAHIPRRKLTAYLLDPTHEDAGGKASYFLGRGFRPDDWRSFADVLHEHAASFPAAETAQDEYGTTFVIEGPLRIPGGTLTKLPVRSVWMIRQAEDFPRFVSAYPVTP